MGLKFVIGKWGSPPKSNPINHGETAVKNPGDAERGERVGPEKMNARAGRDKSYL